MKKVVQFILYKNKSKNNCACIWIPVSQWMKALEHEILQDYQKGCIFPHLMPNDIAFSASLGKRPVWLCWSKDQFDSSNLLSEKSPLEIMGVDLRLHVSVVPFLAWNSLRTLSRAVAPDLTGPLVDMLNFCMFLGDRRSPSKCNSYYWN